VSNDDTEGHAWNNANEAVDEDDVEGHSRYAGNANEAVDEDDE